MFITAVLRTGIKIGDLTHHTGLALASDAPGDQLMAVDKEDATIPEGTEPGGPRLSREEERALVRDSTAGFAGTIPQTEFELVECSSTDWVASLFHRVFSLFENFPEEGGKRNTVPKQEELVLKSVKAMLDIVCLHLSDQLFDLALKLAFNYATTNTRSNSVRVGSLKEHCIIYQRLMILPGRWATRFVPRSGKPWEDD